MRIGSVSANTPVQKAPEQKPPARQNTEGTNAKAAVRVAIAAKSTAAVADTASQEALETAAQTKREAAAGDRQAAQKLAREAAAQREQSAAQPATGQRIKVTA